MILFFNLNCKNEVKVETKKIENKFTLSKFVKNLIETIKNKNKEKVYNFYLLPEQVADYGYFAYGLRGDSSEMKMWRSPYLDLMTKLDSLKVIDKPISMKYIDHKLEDFYKVKKNWNEILITKIDTANSEKIIRTSNFDKKIVNTVSTEVTILLSEKNKKYKLILPYVIYIENEGWFLLGYFESAKFTKEK